MRLVVQRAKDAMVWVDGKVVGAIDHGLVILLGVGHEDTQEDIDYLVKKVSQLRVFNDEEGKMNKSIQDINGAFLVISQFTLFASTKKGNRPSYTRSASPDLANSLFKNFKSTLEQTALLPVESGIFGADMKVDFINDGPVTIILDSKERTY
jgi:D-tyrosyl-tRNA(Tyr) deacylase